MAWKGLAIFSQSQLATLTLLSDLIGEAKSKAIFDGSTEDYANAIVTYLACAIDRASDFNNALTGWGASN